MDISKSSAHHVERAIALALENNNDMTLAHHVQIAEYQFDLRARGVYDPVLSPRTITSGRTTPTSSTLGGAGSKRLYHANGATGAATRGRFSPWEAALSFDFSSTRLTTNNQKRNLEPSISNALSSLTRSAPGAPAL